MVKEKKKKYNYIPNPFELILINLFISPIYLAFFLDNIILKIIAIFMTLILSLIYSFVIKILDNKKIKEEVLWD